MTGSTNLQAIRFLDMFDQSITAATDILKDFNGDSVDIGLDKRVLIRENIYKEMHFKENITITFMAGFDTDGILSYVVKRKSDGHETVTPLNSNSNLKGVWAGELFLSEDYEANFRYSVDANLNYLVILISGGIY